MITKENYEEAHIYEVSDILISLGELLPSNKSIYIFNPTPMHQDCPGTDAV